MIGTVVRFQVKNEVLLMQNKGLFVIPRVP